LIVKNNNTNNTSHQEREHGDKKQQQFYCEVTHIISFCIDLIIDEGQDLIVKKTVFNQFCIPILLKCNEEALVNIFCTTTSTLGNLSTFQSLKKFSSLNSNNTNVIKVLYEIIQKDPNLLYNTEEITNLLFVQSCCYRMIETLFDKCSLNTIKKELTQAFVGGGSTTPNVSGKEFYQAICKIIHKLLRTKLLVIVSTNEISNLLYSSAFRCMCLTVAKTQGLFFTIFFINI
jgi:hypothetical protein